MTQETYNCPGCGESCDRDEVDIGVGTMYGPWRCSRCGWSAPEYDCQQEDSDDDDVEDTWDTRIDLMPTIVEEAD